MSQNLVGVDNVCKFIRSTKCKRYKIYCSTKEILTGVPPMVEHTGDDLEEQFTAFASMLDQNSGIQYSIHCFKSESTSESAQKDKNVATFKLSESRRVENNSVGSVPAGYLSAIEKSHEKELKLTAELAEEKFKNKLLESRLDAIEKRLDEESEGEYEVEVPEKDMIGKAVEQLLPLAISFFTKQPGSPAQAISGVDDMQQSDMAQVITELQQYDTLLLDDLKILLRIAKHQSQTFKMLIATLRQQDV